MRSPENSVSPQTEPTSEAQTILEKDVKAKEHPGNAREGLLLEILSAGSAQVKVSADGSQPKRYVINQGRHVAIRAVKGFNILVEDKCAVALFFNGNPVDMPGRCGLPVALQIP